MESLRLSRTTTGNLTLLTFKETVDQPTSDVPLQTLDGGKSSELRKDSLSTIKERSLKFKTKKKPQMLKTETLWLTPETRISDNNGRLSMLTNTLSQRREN
jgi:hypothetical protein